METCAHRTLKCLAIGFLRETGCAAVATEVRCPISRFKVDVAGYSDRPIAVANAPRCTGIANGAGGGRTRTIMIECKRSRGDFLRDSRKLPQLLALRSQLERIRQSIEVHRIKSLEPQLRRSGTSLFHELEEWDFSASRIPSYKRVLERLQKIDEAIHGQTKFFLIARYALADQLFLAAPKGMIRPREIPPGWGLLECESDQWLEAQAQGDLLSGSPGLRITCAAPLHSSRPVRRLRLLRNIAVAASRHVG